MLPGDRLGPGGLGGTVARALPVVGELVLDWDTFTANTDPDQRLTVWTAAPGTPTHERLRILTSWDRGGYFDITAWSTTGAFPTDSVLLGIAEKLLPTIPERSA